MSEENFNEEQNLEQNTKQFEKERNVANNAKNVRAAAQVAANSGHPVASVIGKGVQAVDKISGGKASEKLGKLVNGLNKMNGIQGKMTQKALNKMAESGTSDRIAGALNKKNSNAQNNQKNNAKLDNVKGDNKSKSQLNDKKNEQTASEAETSLDVTTNFVKKGLMVSAAVLPILIFCVLFISASQIFVNAISLGTADTLSNDEVEDKINKKGTEDLDEEKSDDDVAYDIYISDTKSEMLKNSKLNNNIVQIANEKKYIKRKYNEATIDEIEDFFPSIIDTSKNYDENMVYDFFFKMYTLQKKYRDENTYSVYLDLPLLMATLNLQSTDKNVIFSSNLGPLYRTNSVNDMPVNELDYYYNWDNYVITSQNSEHDMEVLAQHMISKQVKEICVDATGKKIEGKENILKDEKIGTQVLTCLEGETYQTEELGYLVDHDKYKDFLRDFLNKKYYLDGSYTVASMVEEDKLNETLVNGLITEIYDSKQMYEDLAGEQEEETIKIYNALNSSYWLPIGSQETVELSGKIYAKDEPIKTFITSNFGYREDPFGRGTRFHSGVDMACGYGNGIVNIVAAKDGVVVYPTKDVANDCPSSSSQSTCGGGYGNYVIIQHSDGNYTLYAHLDAHSITVVAGESVEQGQVIAKMGSSGNSTGTHLHFEIREGQNTSAATVDGLNYVSLENPRIVSSGGELLAWLNSWESHTEIDGDYYIVEDIGDGVRTVGGGITLEYNRERFLQYGINIDEYPVGSKIEISIVDKMEMEVINARRNDIESILSQNSIILEENQIQALISQMYNIGNINGFTESYQEYGNTNDLYENWFFRSIMEGTKFESGLTRRRSAEWSLFHLGEYIYN